MGHEPALPPLARGVLAGGSVERDMRTAAPPLRESVKWSMGCSPMSSVAPLPLLPVAHPVILAREPPPQAVLEEAVRTPLPPSPTPSTLELAVPQRGVPLRVGTGVYAAGAAATVVKTFAWWVSRYPGI